MAKTKPEQKSDENGPDEAPDQQPPRTAEDSRGDRQARAAKIGKLSFGQKLLTGQFSYNIVAKRKAFYAASVVMVAIAVAALLIRGLTLGIEFRGGAEFEAPTQQATAEVVDDVREALADAEVEDLGAQVNAIGETTIRVQTRALDSTTEVPAVRQVIAEIAGSSPDEVTNSLVGPTWGSQIATQSAIALVVFLILVGAMIGIYFRNWKMSIAALLALAHDLIITVGLYALFGFTVTPASVIGLLTILGYSLYDTVVVFDKVRENTRDVQAGTDEYTQQSNLAINQVIVRSLNTTVTGVIPVAALLILGLPGPLQDLGLVLLIGMIAGAYSSLFLATPFFVDMKRREKVPATSEENKGLTTTRRQEPKVSVKLDSASDSVSLTGSGEGAEASSDGEASDGDAAADTDEADSESSGDTGSDHAGADGGSGDDGDEPEGNKRRPRTQPTNVSRSRRRN